jgi:2-haloacid dehalogenase
MNIVRVISRLEKWNQDIGSDIWYAVGGTLIDFEHFEVLTFDCYGTLIDWETGLWNAMGPVLIAHQVTVTRDTALEMYGEMEFEIERGEYCEYSKVLRKTLRGLCSRLGFTPTEAQLEYFLESLKNWPAFPDSASALRTLKKKYKLALVSNIDDELFALSAPHLQVEFNWIITAQQVRSYKPSLTNFRYALQRIGLPKSKILHVAQSLFHDIVPAKSLGLSTVWVNRRHDKTGFGATLPAKAVPDLEVPDLETLVRHIGPIRRR